MRFCLLVALATLAPMPVFACSQAPTVLASTTLKVLTLNLAHGRGLGMNQMLQKEGTTRDNLARVADLLRYANADVVALQEADAPSRWSGGFDHVQTLAEAADYPCVEHAPHAQSRMYSFGTALLSRHAFADILAHDFQPSWPTTTKGFLLGTLLWNPGNSLDQPLEVNVISVHLDFSRKKVRDAQIAEMSAALKGYEPPVVVMGDFNTDWQKDNSALKRIADEAGLVAWDPLGEGQGTYKKGKKRLDWILVSEDLVIESHGASPVDVSDHRAVIAELSIRKQY
jgi:endonuclease/exonuclease/phosphatase family metal-dependent hydrolase